MKKTLTLSLALRIAKQTAAELVLPPLQHVARETSDNLLRLQVVLAVDAVKTTDPVEISNSTWIRLDVGRDDFEESCRDTWASLTLGMNPYLPPRKRRFALRTM